MTPSEINALIERIERGRMGYSELAQAAIDAVQRLAGEVEDLKTDNTSMLDSLTRESAARCGAEDDAERYRWLKSGADGSTAVFMTTPQDGLDAAIDAARAQGKPDATT